MVLSCYRTNGIKLKLTGKLNVLPVYLPPIVAKLIFIFDFHVDPVADKAQSQGYEQQNDQYHNQQCGIGFANTFGFVIFKSTFRNLTVRV